MSRSFGDFAEELGAEWSDDARRVHDAAAREFAADIEARRALGGSLARARKQAGLTQIQLAALASVQQAEISRIERGHANPTVSTLARIAQATGARLDLVAAST